MPKSLVQRTESGLPGIRFEASPRAEPGRFETGTGSLVVGVAASTAMVIHVFGDGVEGGPGGESCLRNVLTATVLEEMKEVSTGLSGAMVVALFSVRVDRAEVMVELLTAWGIAG